MTERIRLTLSKKPEDGTAAVRRASSTRAAEARRSAAKGPEAKAAAAAEVAAELAAVKAAGGAPSGDGSGPTIHARRPSPTTGSPAVRAPRTAAPRGEKTERSARPARPERPGRSAQPGRPARPERPVRTDSPAGSERPARPARKGRPESSDRPARTTAADQRKPRASAPSGEPVAPKSKAPVKPKASPRPGAAEEAARLELAQGLAAELLLAVSEGRGLEAAQHAAESRMEALGPHLRAVCRDVCFGALRHRGRLLAMLRPLLQKGDPQPVVLELLTIAAYQLLHTRTAPHAIVDHAVRAAVTLTHPAVGGFVNAVLRSLQRQRAELATAADATPEGRFSHPEWWIRRVRRDHPSHWKAILDAAQGHPPLTLRVNRRRSSVAVYLDLLVQAGMAGTPIGADGVWVDPPVPIERLPGFAEGLVSVQDASAQLAAGLLDAQDGERVLDACAAPGGKTAHLLERADLDLLALDHDAGRLERVQTNLARLGLHATTRCADAADLDSWWDGRPFDRILLDAPCTGSGVSRRHPDIRWLRQPGDPARLAVTQLQLAHALWRTLKPGGTLLFATCSLFSDEGPAVVQAFMDRHPDARLHLPVSAPFRDGWVQPDALHDGFFYALFERH